MKVDNPKEHTLRVILVFKQWYKKYMQKHAAEDLSGTGSLFWIYNHIIFMKPELRSLA